MKINIVKNRNIFFTISGLLTIFSLIMIFFGKLNFGIDMTGGTQSEYSHGGNIKIEEVREIINLESEKIIFSGKKVINEISAYNITGKNSISIIAGFDTSIETKKIEELKNDFRKNILNKLQEKDKSIIEVNYTNIGKTFGDYIKNTAITTLLLAILAIALYLAWSFSGIAIGISTMSFAAITIITLFHDVIVAAGLYIFLSIFLPEFKIDTFFITALLTILGYSINDTIVVFDRIRSTIKTMITKNKTLEEIIEISIKDTIRRSIFTSLTLFFVLLTILLFGPESIKGFIVVMLFGTIVGTYSSIYIASPLLYVTNKHKKLAEFKEKERNIEDKIVV